MDPTTDPFWKQLIAALAQKGLTMAFTGLAAYGAVQTSQKAEFMDVGMSIALAAVSMAWTVIHTHNVKTNAQAAVAQAAATGTLPATGS